MDTEEGQIWILGQNNALNSRNHMDAFLPCTYQVRQDGVIFEDTLT